MKSIFTLIILLLISTSVCSSSTPPNSLKRLVSESEVIVIAHVKSVQTGRNEVIEKGDNIQFINEPSIAKLTIIETLKGEVINQINVKFDSFPTCCKPLTYKKNTKIVAFLVKDNIENSYTTHSLGYGLKTLDDEGVKVYKKRIQELQLILKVEDDTIRKTKTVEWLVKCAENKYTRFEGLYELHRENSYWPVYDRNTDTFNTEYKLSESQIQRLRKTLLSLNTLLYDDFRMINIVKTENDQELIVFLKEKFTNYQYSNKLLEDTYMLKKFMEYLAGLTGDLDLNSIYEEYNDEINKSIDNSKLPEEKIKKFKKVLTEI
jgi:hypothetical protein